MPTSTIETHSTCRTSPFTETIPEVRRLSDHAREVIADLSLFSIPDERLAIIVRAGIEVRNLLFVAALNDPTPFELHDAACDFIRRAVTSSGIVQ
jgi:hypothetical protein